MEAASYTALGGLIVVVLGAVVAGIARLGGMRFSHQRIIRRDTIDELYNVIDLLKGRLDTVEARADKTDQEHADCERRSAKADRRITQLIHACIKAGINVPAPEDTGEHPSLDGHSAAVDQPGPVAGAGTGSGAPVPPDGRRP